MKTASKEVFVGDMVDTPKVREKLAWMDISDSLKELMIGEAEFTGYRSIDVGDIYAVYYPLDFAKSRELHEKMNGKDGADTSGLTDFGLNVLYLDPKGSLAETGHPVFVVCTISVSEQDGVTLCTVMEAGLHFGGVEFLRKFCRYQSNLEKIPLIDLAIGSQPQKPTLVSVAYPIRRFFMSKDKLPLPPVIDDSQGIPVAVIQQASIDQIVGMMGDKQRQQAKKTSKREAFTFPGTKGQKPGHN
jgi:hypothetical protein